MKLYTAVFEWEDGKTPAVAAGDEWKGGTLCAIAFRDEFVRMELLEEALSALVTRCEMELADPMDVSEINQAKAALAI